MNKKMRRMILLTVALGVCWLSQSPARAEDLDGRIRTLEEELTKLKEQQVEMKKEATAAAVALPTFEYRPGNGLNIEAGDKSWGLRATIETHFRYLFEAGRAQQGRTDGELMGRRFSRECTIASTIVCGKSRRYWILMVSVPAMVKIPPTLRQTQCCSAVHHVKARAPPVLRRNTIYCHVTRLMMAVLGKESCSTGTISH